MLIPYRKNGIEDHDQFYIEAKTRIDILCTLIISGNLTADTAMSIYGEIEGDYSGLDPEGLELFNMIYKNRVKRLCQQFCGDK